MICEGCSVEDSDLASVVIGSTMVTLCQDCKGWNKSNSDVKDSIMRSHPEITNEEYKHWVDGDSPVLRTSLG